MTDIEYTIDVETATISLYPVSERGENFLTAPNPDGNRFEFNYLGAVQLSIYDGLFDQLDTLGLILEERKPN